MAFNKSSKLLIAIIGALGAIASTIIAVKCSNQNSKLPSRPQNQVKNADYSSVYQSQGNQTIIYGDTSKKKERITSNSSTKPSISITQGDNGVVQLGPNSTINKYGTDLKKAVANISAYKMNIPKDSTFGSIQASAQEVKYKTVIYISLKGDIEARFLAVYFGEINNFCSFEWAYDPSRMFFNNPRLLTKNNKIIGTAFPDLMPGNYILNIYTKDEIADLGEVLEVMVDPPFLINSISK